MINLPVNEAEAFDYLSILQVKLDRGLPVDARYSEVALALDSTDGIDIEQVLASYEYNLLYGANALCFDAIERAHRDEISARAVQRLNHDRYLAKRALQARFWPTSPLTERKTL